MDDYILWFDELGMNDLERVGGKNASLGEMISNLAVAGVSVPNGFATTAHAYREFLAHDMLVDRINRALGSLDVGDVFHDPESIPNRPRKQSENDWEKHSRTLLTSKSRH